MPSLPNNPSIAPFVWDDVSISSSYPDIARRQILTQKVKENAILLVQGILKPVNDKWGPLIPTSWYRGPELNAKIGGVNDSQHTRGEAVDFLCINQNMLEVYYWIVTDLQWSGEVLHYRKRGHIHVALPEPNVHPDHLILEK